MGGRHLSHQSIDFSCIYQFIPRYTVLVTWLYGNSKYKVGLLGKIFRTKNLTLFLLLIFMPAFIEKKVSGMQFLA